MVIGAVPRAVLTGILVTAVAMAGHGDAHSASGAVGGSAPEHASVGVLERGGRAVCTASLVGPGWAITAAHCLAETPQSLRLLSGHGEPLALGPAHRSPDGGDLALIEVPAAAARMPWLTPGRDAIGCAGSAKPVALVGGMHSAGRFTSTPTRATLLLGGQCSTASHAVPLAAPAGASVQLCPGDSGSPILRDDGDSPVVEAVVVSEVLDAQEQPCGRSTDTVGLAEPLATDARIAWLDRTAAPPNPRPGFQASLASAPGGRVRIQPRAWQGAPPPGTRVTVTDRQGRTWARATVRGSGAIVVPKPPAGIYRVESYEADGVRRSAPLRIARTLPDPVITVSR